MRHVCKEFALCLAGLGKFGIKPFKLGSVLLFRRDGAIFLNLQNDVYHNRRDHKHNSGKYQHDVNRSIYKRNGVGGDIGRGHKEKQRPTGRIHAVKRVVYFLSVKDGVGIGRGISLKLGLGLVKRMVL